MLKIYCDLCGKEVRPLHNLYKLNVSGPVKGYNPQKMILMDLCDECCKNLTEWINKQTKKD